MLRLTLAQMRRSTGRLVAAAVAIAIGSAFLTATLLASSTMTRTTYDAVTTGLADADLVVAGHDAWDWVPQDEVDALRGAGDVAAVMPVSSVYAETSGPGGTAYVEYTAAAEDPRLERTVLTEGSRPARADQVALPDDVAERLELEIGDHLTAQLSTWDVAADGTETEQVTRARMEVVGLLDGSASAFLGTTVALMDAGQYEQWASGYFSGGPRDYSHVLLALADGASVTEVRDDLSAAVGGSYAVRTQDEQAAALVAQMSGSTNQMTALVLGFAGVALIVAGLVITNTFQVLVAQRTRTLALLRCVGANRRQLRASVVTEALLLGVAASVVGVLLGTGVVQVALSVLTAGGTDVPLPAAVPVTAAALVVPVLVGTGVTVLAALSPARAATRVPPLAALQPAHAPTLAERSGRARAWISGLLVVGGLAGLGLGLVATREVDVMVGLAVGMLGGAVSFVGVLVGAVFWVPRLTGAVGRLAGRNGNAATRLAAANSVRNPRRTAATSAALLIGVTLVVMMSTGAASARSALVSTLDEQFPVDISAEAPAGVEGPGLPAAFVEQVRALDGVESAATLLTTTSDVLVGDGTRTQVDLRGAPDDAAGALHTPEMLAGLADGTAVVPAQVARWTGIDDGETFVLGDDLELTASVTRLPDTGIVVTEADLAKVDASARPGLLWVSLTDVDTADDVVATVEQAAVETESGIYVTGAAVERAFYQQVIDTLLAVVVGLLAVAVVIAVVGVTNTLSLSVLERRRESATLRALGLSRRQLRATLAVEGVLIALVGAVAGVALGTVYGWVGALTALAPVGTVSLAVSWPHIGAVVAGAVLAGLLASAIPARSAARTSPVAALAVD